MVTLTVRTGNELIEELDRLARLNHTDRATEARKILMEGITKAKLEMALKIYRDGQSIGRAADVVNVNLWDLIEYFAKTGQTLIVDKESLKQEFIEALEE